MDGRSKGIHIYKGMPFEEFTQRVLEKFDISIDVMRMHYSLKFNPRVIQDLENEDALDNVFSHNDDFANVGPSSTFSSSNAPCDAISNAMMLSRGFASCCAKSGRFQYKYKKNSPNHMLVKCLVEGYPWKIATHVVEGNENLIGSSRWGCNYGDACFPNRCGFSKSSFNPLKWQNRW
ncbi:hypothetical protein CK203_041990 [Vitis vinifera]|uniref:Transposase MuDR plant domain-containing protein n=1 Tax=Vitis vinifera TaxID=29760 RepID=A0A438I0E9_VITVI|nr:hypothetical protein CK203_041990 [Vitis vinifera]